MTYDAEVIDLDRAQAPFKMTFAEFVRKRVDPKRVARGQRIMAENADLLAEVGIPCTKRRPFRG